MTNLYADIILFDTIGSPYTGETAITSGMGGSEFQAILLLEEFAKLGKKVICLNNTQVEKSYNDVLYLPNNSVFKYKIKCDHLILHRNSVIPKIPHKHCYQWVTDNNSPHNLPYYQYLDSGKMKMVTLSNYSSQQYSDSWNKSVINFIIPDWVYDYKLPTIKKDYIYASSLMKGYGYTLEYWKYLKSINKLQDKRLKVCLPGYDNPQNDISENSLDVDYLGTLTFKQVVELMASCEGLFYANFMTETFCISAVLAEILQTTPYIYCLNGYGALKEVLNSDTIVDNNKQFFDDVINGRKCDITPKDYRSDIVMKQWCELMNF